VVSAQGGDPMVITAPEKLPHAAVVQRIAAPRSGRIAAIDAEQVGRVAGMLGAGRQRKEDTIDPSVGLILLAKVGDHLAKGAPLVEVHAASKRAASAVRARLLAAYRWSDQPPSPCPLLLGQIGG
jgi:pyrimidine-nucleoside phosphorylase